MENKAPVPLSSAQFELLHQSIVDKCDALLRKWGHARGLNRKNDQFFYGFMAGDDPRKKTDNSIKAVVIKHLLNHGFDFSAFRHDDKGHLLFNGRLLQKLHFNWRRGDPEIEVPACYLDAFRAFVSAPYLDEESDMAELPDSNLITHPLESNPDFHYTFDRALQNLAQTHWYLYEFSAKVNSEEPPIIVRSRFRILNKNENGDYNAELHQSLPFSTFVGRLVRDRSHEKILIFRFATRDTGAKYLEMMFQVEPTLSQDLYLGIALRYDSSDKVRANTLVLEKRNEPFDALSSTEFTFPIVDDNSELPPALQRYFSEKTQNLLKIPPGISTFYDLENWLRKKNKSAAIPNLVAPSKFDLFIACPISALDNPEDSAELERLRVEIQAMREDPLLEEMGIVHTYCPLCDEPFSIKEASKILLDEFERLQASKAYLLIYNVNRPLLTSVFMQLGWATQAGKPVFIICQNRDHIPRLIRHAYALPKVSMNENPVAIREIPAWLEANDLDAYFR